MWSPAPTKPATPARGAISRARARLPGGMTTVPIRVWGAGNIDMVIVVPVAMVEPAIRPDSWVGSVTASAGRSSGRTALVRMEPSARATEAAVPAWTVVAA